MSVYYKKINYNKYTRMHKKNVYCFLEDFFGCNEKMTETHKYDDVKTILKSVYTCIMCLCVCVCARTHARAHAHTQCIGSRSTNFVSYMCIRAYIQVRKTMHETHLKLLVVSRY